MNLSNTPLNIFSSDSDCQITVTFYNNTSQVKEINCTCNGIKYAEKWLIGSYGFSTFIINVIANNAVVAFGDQQIEYIIEKNGEEIQFTPLELSSINIIQTIDIPLQKIVSCIYEKNNQILSKVLWVGAEYDTIGQWTDFDVINKIQIDG